MIEITKHIPFRCNEGQLQNPVTGECTSIECPLGYEPRDGKCNGKFSFWSLIFKIFILIHCRHQRVSHHEQMWSWRGVSQYARRISVRDLFRVCEQCWDSFFQLSSRWFALLRWISVQSRLGILWWSVYFPRHHSQVISLETSMSVLSPMRARVSHALIFPGHSNVDASRDSSSARGLVPILLWTRYQQLAIFRRNVARMWTNALNSMAMSVMHLRAAIIQLVRVATPLTHLFFTMDKLFTCRK